MNFLLQSHNIPPEEIGGYQPYSISGMYIQPDIYFGLRVITEKDNIQLAKYELAALVISDTSWDYITTPENGNLTFVIDSVNAISLTVILPSEFQKSFIYRSLIGICFFVGIGKKSNDVLTYLLTKHKPSMALLPKEHLKKYGGVCFTALNTKVEYRDNRDFRLRKCNEWLELTNYDYHSLTP